METLLFREVNRCPETEKSDSSKETSQNPSSTNISSRCVDYGPVMVYGWQNCSEEKRILMGTDPWRRETCTFSKAPYESPRLGCHFSKGIIGPYFFHADGKNISVNKYTYQTCVQWFVSELKKRRRFKRAVFMQDGAKPHTALSTREYLRQTFHGCVIGKHFDKPWPPYSPDLTISICGLHPNPICIQGRTHTRPYRSVAQLKRAITFTFKKFRAKKFDFIPEQVVNRWRLCVHHKGDRWFKT